ncbi:MAG: single-stranded DNA-binding protein [Corynebacterium sp.]|nr:single-stranded DNA-binding protein [Corynebacterium sp.]
MPATRVTLIGNICSDVLKKEVNGSSLTKFRMACDRSLPIRDDNGTTTGYEQRDLLFIEVQGWGRLAENMFDALHNGMGVVVEGKLISYKWSVVDEDTGEERTGTKIVCRADRAGVDLSRRGVVAMPTFAEMMGVTRADVTEEAKTRAKQRLLMELAGADGATTGIFPVGADADEIAEVEAFPGDGVSLAAVEDLVDGSEPDEDDAEEVEAELAAA